MFFYFSMLVELGDHFQEIHIGFIIVGHTHCSIDQYFSIISEAVKKCKFIGSREALWYLYSVCHHREDQRPTIQRQLEVVFDYKSAFEPYINHKIQGYRFPHCFKIRYLVDIDFIQHLDTSFVF